MGWGIPPFHYDKNETTQFTGLNVVNPVVKYIGNSANHWFYVVFWCCLAIPPLRQWTVLSYLICLYLAIVFHWFYDISVGRYSLSFFIFACHFLSFLISFSISISFPKNDVNYLRSHIAEMPKYQTLEKNSLDFYLTTNTVSPSSSICILYDIVLCT